MRRLFLIACGTLLISIPLLWVVFYLTGSVLTYWFVGLYPSRNGLGIFVLSLFVGIVMVLAGLDIVSSWRNSK